MAVVEKNIPVISVIASYKLCYKSCLHLVIKKVFEFLLVESSIQRYSFCRLRVDLSRFCNF